MFSLFLERELHHGRKGYHQSIQRTAQVSVAYGRFDRDDASYCLIACRICSRRFQIYEI